MSKRLAELNFILDDTQDGNVAVSAKQSGISDLTKGQLHALLVGAMQLIESLTELIEHLPDDRPQLLLPDVVRAAESIIRSDG